ncbi:MAG: polysaccharide export protein EpsE [Vicinamibacterales bacterium]
MLTTRALCALIGGLLITVTSSDAQAQSAGIGELVLGGGDIVRIAVLQNPDLTTEVRVSENGTVSFPYIGIVPVGGLTLPQGEKKIADLLREGGFVAKPQVNILPVQIRSRQVAVLGQVNRPGRYPLEAANVRLSDMLANAGGIAATGADTVVLMGTREGKAIRREIDIPMLVSKGDSASDVPLAGGDVLYVNRAPMFYIYGEVQRAGAFRLERNMTVMQGLAAGGGLTGRGTDKGLRVHRRGADGALRIIEAKLDEPLEADDVIYVREGLF